ncbi:hypothetical protein PH586_09065 [Pseudomonas sp. SA3-5]|uniref:Uncharacterized protein n=1 Tax=Pseudomonas aestuarii TaxID=3018340 RepID=A0ABT4XEB2_9PSED|nr:hypothetical protein [Pseudomonas aestuarii]MDA7086527.1 hypothetical protein [Pseudomonas aestuarii]
MNILSQPDYRDSMQAAALGFLQRHQSEHLADDGALFDRATSHLVNTLEVPVFMAPRLVHLAMSNLGKPQQPWIGIDLAIGTDRSSDVWVIDRRNGERALMPRRILPSRFITSHNL